MESGSSTTTPKEGGRTAAPHPKEEGKAFSTRKKEKDSHTSPNEEREVRPKEGGEKAFSRPEISWEGREGTSAPAQMERERKRLEK